MKHLFNVWLLLAAPAAGARKLLPSPATPAAPAARLRPRDRAAFLGLSFGEQMHRVSITDQLSVDAITRGLGTACREGRPLQPSNNNGCHVRLAMESAVARNQATAKNSWRAILREGRDHHCPGLRYKFWWGVASGAITPATKLPCGIAARCSTARFDSSYSAAPFDLQGERLIQWQEALC